MFNDKWNPLPLFLGVKVEGILRQSADVEEVKRRIQDYEKGDFFGLNLLFSYLGYLRLVFGSLYFNLKIICLLHYVFIQIFYEGHNNVWELYFYLL